LRGFFSFQAISWATNDRNLELVGQVRGNPAFGWVCFVRFVRDLDWSIKESSVGGSGVASQRERNLSAGPLWWPTSDNRREMTPPVGVREAW